MMAHPRLTTGTPFRRVERALRPVPTEESVDEEQDRLEAALLARIGDGDVRAFEQLYDRYSRRVYSLALRLIGNTPVAQETAQEVFLSLWRGARDFEPRRGTVRSWILSLAHHKSVDAVRRLRLRAAEPLGEAMGQNPVGALDVVEEVLRTLEGATVRDALLELPREQREAIGLAYYGGYTQQGIAEKLRIPLGTVKTRIRDGMQRLRELLSAQEGREQ